MTLQYSDTEIAALLALPRPDPKAIGLEDGSLAAYRNRESALEAVLNGASINQVSKSHRLPRSTIERMVELVGAPALGGGVNGFRVCIEGLKLVVPKPKMMTMPTNGGALSMTRVIAALPKLGERLAAFKGALPQRNIPSPAFNRLHTGIERLLKEAGHENAYPLNTADRGRRAICQYIARQRQLVVDSGMADLPDHPDITRLEHLFELRPMDRVEVDAHQIDVKEAYAAVLRSDGTYTLSRISGMWLLAMVDVASRAIVAWTLVIGSAYNRDDLLELVSKSLTPWTPRALMNEKARYLANAWMPSCCLVDELMPRPLITALDNARAHTSAHTRANLLDFQLGVYHFGPSGIPEVRAFVEAFFKQFEELVLRFIAGGFVPETASRPEQAVSTKQAKDHPIFVEALEDLLDVAITTYNVTGHTGIQKRSPREMFESYLAAGGLVLRSHRTQEDASDLVTLRLTVTFRGKKDLVLVHVNLGGARYRSPKTNKQWKLIGHSYQAVVGRDARTIEVKDEQGLPWVTLHALPPYARTPHTLRERKRAEQWRKSTGKELEGMEDAIADYHAYVLSMVKKLRWAADDVASGRISPPQATPAPPPISAYSLQGLPPRNGPVRLR